MLGELANWDWSNHLNHPIIGQQQRGGWIESFPVRLHDGSVIVTAPVLAWWPLPGETISSRCFPPVDIIRCPQQLLWCRHAVVICH
jgi:hypothetical protein